jgi:hypothetical protein
MSSQKTKKIKDEEHREVDLNEASVPVAPVVPEKVPDIPELAKFQTDLAELLLSNEKANQTLDKLDQRISNSSSEMEGTIAEVKACVATMQTRLSYLEGAVAEMKFAYPEEKHSEAAMNEAQIRALVVQTTRSMITQSSR